MSTSAVEVGSEKVKAMLDKRLIEIFCDICIKKILKGNRPDTHFTKDGWLKIMTNFEKETSKGFSQDNLKIGEDTSLGWNPIKRTIYASNEWWESRLQAPSSGTLRSDFFEDVNNEIPEENEEENVRNDVHISNDVQIDGNGQKRKNPKISSSHFKTGRKKSSKKIGGAARLSSQIEKLCNAADNMSQATSSLTPVMNPYGVPQAVKSAILFALKLFLNKDKRIMFLSTNPKIRALWLKMETEDS
ncbi:hypothetical protein V6Z11_D07G155600 [Gossypium hirsutum]